jgi:hypothetical protein
MRKTLGPNINPEGGMMAAMGWGTLKPVAQTPPVPQTTQDPPAERVESSPPVPDAEPVEAAANAQAPRPPRARPATTRPSRPPELPTPASLPEPTSVLLGPLSRIPTDIDRRVLNLARRAAHWNRETLRSFLERAIAVEAGRVAAELQFEDGLPAAPPLPSGRRVRV